MWQVIQLGPGSMRVVGADAGTPQRVYRVFGGDPNIPPRASRPSQHRTAGPLSFHNLQASASDGKYLPISPGSAGRMVSYQIHPVRSAADFSRPAMTEYSRSELYAPVNQHEGGPGTCNTSVTSGSWTTANDRDRYDSAFYRLIFLIVCFSHRLNEV